VAVAEAQSISRAAARLRIAQPAISRQIRNLEIELGRTLFVRSERGVSLTAPGRDYLASIKAVLRQLDDANDSVRSSASPAAVLHLGIVQLAQWYPRVTEIVTDFRARHPDVRLEALQMPSSAQVDALFAGQIDIAIGVPFFELPPDVTSIHLFSVERGTVMSVRHPLADKPDLSTRDIQDFPLITTARNTWTGSIDRFFAASRAEGFVPDFAETFDNFSLLLSRLRDEHSIAIMPQPGPDAPMDELVFRRIPSIDYEMPITVYWRAKSPPPLVAAFAQLVRDKSPPAAVSSADQ
jgi:DNA-binding transcriptional LysR family regulator